jgi:N-acetylneuraminic acid mutarotase
MTAVFRYTCICVAVTSTLAGIAAPRPASTRPLTFEDRVAAQRAIERVYYSHQIGPTKQFDEAVTRTVLERKIRTYLEQTVALEAYWNWRVTDEMLDRELARMAHDTKLPNRLSEIFAALDNDPILIKECLVRGVLVGRLTRQRFFSDPVLHNASRREAEEIRQRLITKQLSPRAGHQRRSVITLHAGRLESSVQTLASQDLELSPEQLRVRRARLPRRIGEVSDIEEAPEAFSMTVLLSEDATTTRLAVYSVPRLTWESWWETSRLGLREDRVSSVTVNSRMPTPGRPEIGGSDSRLAGAENPECVPDTWSPISTQGAPSERWVHTAIWTGNLMIVWGGYSNVSLDTGGRYDPTTDTWTSTSQTGAPSPRYSHTAVWTGSQMVVWGGFGFSSYLNTGGRYDPLTDSWSSTSVGTDVPPTRGYHTAIWTGSEVIVWGGYGNSGLQQTGGRYNPISDMWSPTSTAQNVPAKRQSHVAVWTGSEMIVWGGIGLSMPLDSGGRYNPVTDTWIPTSTAAGVPSARYYHAAAWTGTKMFVWGGVTTNTGGLYDPSSDTWQPTSIGTNVPAPKYNHTIVWSGVEMLVWGGGGSSAGSNTGTRYNPLSDSWTPTSTAAGVPAARGEHTATWTGTSMLVWGGSPVTATGGSYCACPGGQLMYRDSDGDGFGNPALSTAACGAAPPGYVTNRNDCNDSNATVHPSGTETCNAIDDNCNGTTDENCSAVCAMVSAGLVSWWAGNGSAGDQVGTNDGVLLHGASIAPGLVSMAFDLDGIDDYVLIPDAPTLSPSALTLDAWIYPHSLPTGDVMAVVNKGDYSYRLQLEGRPSFPAGVTWALYCGGWIDVFSGIQPPLDSWTHIAGTYDGAAATVYVNGSLVNTVAVSCLSTSTQDLAIGVNLDFPTRPHFNGLVDEVHLYGRALTGSEVTAIYQSGVHGVCACTDSDADGYLVGPGCSTPQDCDDTRASVHPNAPETCDGRDNDCNTLVDEDSFGVESDGDTIHNACDNCRFAFNPDQLDADEDGVGSACDNCITAANSGQEDLDADQRGDACDNCPAAYNPFQDDSDIDRRGDACDNCVFDFNPPQSDFDHDGQGDRCDLNDGLIYVFSTDPNYIEWQSETGRSSWGVYEGDLAVLKSTGIYSQAPGSNPLAHRTCGVTQDYVDDFETPAAGKVKFSLVTGVTGGIEGSLGTNSAGATRPNANPCP